MRKNFTRLLAVGLLMLSIPQAWAQNDLTLYLVFDQYRSETSWELTNAADAVVAEGGDYGGDFNDSGEYPHPPIAIADLPDGEYTLTVFDEWGDGMCCQYGDGSYLLIQDSDDSEVAAGGAFSESESTTFQLPFLPPAEGCTDPEAINFDPDAEIDDGSCEYLTSEINITLELFANGLASPVALSNAGDDRLFVCEQSTGRVKILDLDGNDLGTFIDVGSDISTGGERGLLGVVFHPDYANNGYFYLNFTNNSGDTEIVRYTVSAGDPNAADANSGEVVLTINQPFSNHNAGDMKFGPDGYLYIPMGDGGSAGDPDNYAQNPNDLLGKIVRIDVNGDDFPGDNERNYAIPADNPFVGDPGVLDEIWALGMRNPWRFSFDRETGDLWIGDVGQNAYEELNFTPAESTGGENYGWRCYEGFNVYNNGGCGPESDYTMPIFEYNHNTFGWCSIIGGFVYRGAQYPLIEGMYFTTDYCNGAIFGITKNAAGDWQQETVNTQFDGGFGTVAFGEDANGELYVVRNNGNIYRIEEPCSAFIPEITEDAGLLTATEGESYQWLFEGDIIDGATSQTYQAMDNGEYTVVVDAGNGCVLVSDPIQVVVSSVQAPNPLTGIVLSPNPTKDQLNLQGQIDRAGQLNYALIDGTGRMVAEGSMGYVTGSVNRSIDLQGYSEGVYFVRLSLDGDIQMRRVVVVR